MPNDIPHGRQFEGQVDQKTGPSSTNREQSKSYIPLRDLFCRSQSVPPPERATYNDLCESPYTSLPKKLKAAAEHLFPGLLLNNVHVYYNSKEAANLGRSAFTKGGEEIHFKQGENYVKYIDKKVFDHEMGHLIQQLLVPMEPTGNLRGKPVNEDRREEEEADMIGRAIREVSEDPTRLSRVLTDLSKTELYFRYRKNMSRLDQRKTPSKDVIQMYPEMYQTQGEFSTPDSTVAKALRTVMSSLSRNAARSLAYYGNDHYDDSSPRTDLVFRSISMTGGRAANTGFFALIEGDWHNLDEICDPQHPSYHLSLQLNLDTRIGIYIDVDTRSSGDPVTGSESLRALNHEINVHAIHALPWLQKLRSGAYTGEEIRASWRTSIQPGALLNAREEHRVFARGDNRSYNVTARRIYANLPEEERSGFRTETRRAIDHYYYQFWTSGTPRYPI